MNEDWSYEEMLKFLNEADWMKGFNKVSHNEIDGIGMAAHIFDKEDCGVSSKKILLGAYYTMVHKLQKEFPQKEGCDRAIVSLIAKFDHDVVWVVDAWYYVGQQTKKIKNV